MEIDAHNVLNGTIVLFRVEGLEPTPHGFGENPFEFEINKINFWTTQCSVCKEES